MSAEAYAASGDYWRCMLDFHNKTCKFCGKTFETYPEAPGDCPNGCDDIAYDMSCRIDCPEWFPNDYVGWYDEEPYCDEPRIAKIREWVNSLPEEEE